MNLQHSDQEQRKYLSFRRLIEFSEYQPKVLVVGKIIIQPVTEYKEPVLDSKNEHQVQSHPDHPC